MFLQTQRLTNMLFVNVQVSSPGLSHHSWVRFESPTVHAPSQSGTRGMFYPLVSAHIPQTHTKYMVCLVEVQSLSHVQLPATPWTAACQASLSFTVSCCLLRLMSIESMVPSSHLILWCPLFLLPKIVPSIRDFSSELSVCIRWPKSWSFSFTVSLSSEYTGLP